MATPAIPVRTLCCEGLCSRAYDHPQHVTRLRAAGWMPDQVRSDLSSRMVCTEHYESRRLVNRPERVVVVFYTCSVCQHERQYGIEEL